MFRFGSRSYNFFVLKKKEKCVFLIHVALLCTHSYGSRKISYQLKLGWEIAIRLPIEIRKGRIAIKNF
jgi:hypothetical protein